MALLPARIIRGGERIIDARTNPLVLSVAVAAAVLLSPDAAHAYGGPGSVISGLGALLAAVAAIVAALFGFLWFPLKRLIRALRGTPEEGDRPEGSEDIVRE